MMVALALACTATCAARMTVRAMFARNADLAKDPAATAASVAHSTATLVTAVLCASLAATAALKLVEVALAAARVVVGQRSWKRSTSIWALVSAAIAVATTQFAMAAALAIVAVTTINAAPLILLMSVDAAIATCDASAIADASSVDALLSCTYALLITYSGWQGSVGSCVGGRSG